MAKRVSVLDSNYNPVGSRLRRVLLPTVDQNIETLLDTAIGSEFALTGGDSATSSD
jgi:hypothetical protein